MTRTDINVWWESLVISTAPPDSGAGRIPQAAPTRQRLGLLIAGQSRQLAQLANSVNSKHLSKA